VDHSSSGSARALVAALCLVRVEGLEAQMQFALACAAREGCWVKGVCVVAAVPLHAGGGRCGFL
jgi:hypothetical protein